ncbi:MAG TPA: antibiotic biosynthesis monooxygenase [Gammaproteobacteria bacterium]
MILREWRGRVPHEKADAYVDVLGRTGLAEYAATPGHRGSWLLVDREGDAAEFTLLTLWESRDAIRAFAGDDISRAVYYPEDDAFLLEKPERLRHYDVLRRP